MIIFVNICNLASALIIIAFWLHEKSKLPKNFVWQMSLRYVRFFLIYALMMNRYNRYALWSLNISGNTPVPHWPFTWQEKIIFIAYCIFATAGILFYFILYFGSESGLTQSTDTVQYKPLRLTTLLYPAMLPSMKLVKGRASAILSGSIVGLIYMFGFFNILSTTLFSLKNIR